MIFSLTGWACGQPPIDASAVPDPAIDLNASADAGPQTAVLAGGCFWCTEAVFEQLQGITEVTSGYAGGKQETADYQSVCSGTTDHAEAIRITYDPAQISYGQLLKVFFTVAHDPTQLNRQGPDTGKPYRSAIFYESDEQKNVAQAYIHQLDDAKVYGQPIVTTLEPLNGFYPAEAYHQDYASLNPDHPYIRQQAMPKVQKVRQYFTDSVKQQDSE